MSRSKLSRQQNIRIQMRNAAELGYKKIKYNLYKKEKIKLRKKGFTVISKAYSRTMPTPCIISWAKVEIPTEQLDKVNLTFAQQLLIISNLSLKFLWYR